MLYRRSRIAGGTYFFTVVTDGRRPFLCEPGHITLLRSVLRDVMGRHPFTIDAMVVLPDHLHAIWTLPADDCDYAIRWSLVKGGFTRSCAPHCKSNPSASRRARKEQAVWQHRFWEHAIRDEEDFAKHVDYIHYNPVKHRHAAAPRDWPYSSFHRFVRSGHLPLDWAAVGGIDIADNIGNE